MIEFDFSDSHRRQELDRLQSRNITRGRLFLLLLGPSATGKSTIIDELVSRTAEPSFEYVKPFITRPNRPGETDKVSITDTVFDQMGHNGDFLAVNKLYGVRYGTPMHGILDPLKRGVTPVLDYPLDTVSGLKSRHFETLKIYIYPPSIKEWINRMEQNGRNMNGRFESGAKELGALAATMFVHPDIDISIVNKDGESILVAEDILEIVQSVRQ